jgi:hypothetical protein
MPDTTTLRKAKMIRASMRLLRPAHAEEFADPNKNIESSLA